MSSRIASKTYGTVSVDRKKAMTGLEFVQGLANGTPPLNTIARTLGYDVTEAECPSGNIMHLFRGIPWPSGAVAAPHRWPRIAFGAAPASRLTVSL